MAYTVGTALMILCFIGLPLRYGLQVPIVVEVVGVMHGVLYPIYLLVSLDLARRARFSLLQMGAMVGAGLLPGLAFVIERRITRMVREQGVQTWGGRPVPGTGEAAPIRSAP